MGQRTGLCDCTAKRHMRYFCCTEARELQATGYRRPLAELLINNGNNAVGSRNRNRARHCRGYAVTVRRRLARRRASLSNITICEPVIPRRTDRTFVGRMAGDDICGALSPIVTPHNSHWDSSSDNVDAIPYINDIPFDDNAYAAVWAEAQAIRSRNE